jgi:diguanylate cyclase (GGDEF)-like protein/PAS domain S-box-containing protein
LHLVQEQSTVWIGRLVPHSIVARTTLCILALSLLLGLVFAAGASVWAQQEEDTRLQIGLQELLSAVNSTAQIACFLGDANLAREISQGLLKNHSVSGVRIAAGGRPLYDSPGTAAAATNRGGTRVISQTIYSPFDQKTTVGEVSLYASDAAIRAQARRYSWNFALVLGLQVVVIAAGVAVVVIVLVTRPITAISDDLHALQIDTGMQLRAPRGNQSNEIGRLVCDVNSLILRLTALLTEERDLRVEHEMQERIMKLIINKAQTGIFVLGRDGVVESWNPAFEHIVGFNNGPGSTRAPRIEELLAPHGSEVASLIENVLLTGEPGDLDLEIRRTGNSGSTWIELSLNVIGPATLQGVVNDITERKRVELSSQRLAIHDPLTGLLNLRGLEGTLFRLFNEPCPQRMHLVLLQIDLDHFKEVNDTYGHEAGDRVLREVGSILGEAVRGCDIVGRQGGDEFMAILVDVETPPVAREIAERIVARVQQPIDVGNGKTARISASIGVAFRHFDDSAGSLRRRADQAMYEAKRSGRARVRFAAHLADARRLVARTGGLGEDR